MREWLILQLTKLIMAIMGRKGADTPVETEGAKTEPAQVKCPICGEDWDEGEIFCYHCGYEQKDEELPLHPPPERTGELTDPDAFLDESVSAAMRERLKEIAGGKGIDVAVLVVPASLREAVSGGKADGRSYRLDGISYALYNTWGVGKGTGLRGLLLAIDPASDRRVLAQGLKGPGLTGAAFREWYSTYSPPDDTDPKKLLAAELSHVVARIQSV